MFDLAAAPTRLTRRLSGARARRQALAADRAFLTAGRSSWGDTFAVGLGCDGWKPRQP